MDQREYDQFGKEFHDLYNRQTENPEELDTQIENQFNTNKKILEDINSRKAPELFIKEATALNNTAHNSVVKMNEEIARNGRKNITREFEIKEKKNNLTALKMLGRSLSKTLARTKAIGLMAYKTASAPIRAIRKQRLGRTLRNHEKELEKKISAIEQQKLNINKINREIENLEKQSIKANEKVLASMQDIEKENDKTKDLDKRISALWDFKKNDSYIPDRKLESDLDLIEKGLYGIDDDKSTLTNAEAAVVTDTIASEDKGKEVSIHTSFDDKTFDALQQEGYTSAQIQTMAIINQYYPHIDAKEFLTPDVPVNKMPYIAACFERTQREDGSYNRANAEFFKSMELSQLITVERASRESGRVTQKEIDLAYGQIELEKEVEKPDFLRPDEKEAAMDYVSEYDKDMIEAAQLAEHESIPEEIPEEVLFDTLDESDLPFPEVASRQEEELAAAQEQEQREKEQKAKEEPSLDEACAKAFAGAATIAAAKTIDLLNEKLKEGNVYIMQSKTDTYMAARSSDGVLHFGQLDGNGFKEISANIMAKAMEESKTLQDAVKRDFAEKDLVRSDQEHNK